jgi:hypothetical protein
LDIELEIIIHQTAFEFLSYNEKDNTLDILQNSSLKLVESSDVHFDGDRTLMGWHLYVKVPMDEIELVDELIKEDIFKAYNNALGADCFLRGVQIEIKKVKNPIDYTFYEIENYFQIGSKYDYDVVLSFAGEDRNYVEKVANYLLYKKIKVFYDNFETVENWSKDLYTHFDEIYRKKAKYCVMFISKNYADKLWTNHERRSAQTRSFEEKEEYILPVRFDETEIPGITPTIGYINGNKISGEKLAELIVKKLLLGYLDIP